ncbi:MAG: metallophosphoesterase [Patescibacteria group bacterium]|nr:metallophosphoesterase [Patescibacteria group bacterium]
MILTSLGVIAFYLSYFLAFFLIYLIWPGIQAGRTLRFFLILICLIFLYARFIEPRIIRIKRRQINFKNPLKTGLKIVIISDLHIGLFTKKSLLTKAVKKINNLNPDLVFIPGDFVWRLPENKIEKNLADLKKLMPRTLAVLGNHDCGNQHEKDVSKKLMEILLKCGIKVIDNKIETIKIRGQEIRIVGLADLETRKPDYNLLKNLSRDDINIILEHNPDAAYEFPSYNMNLVVCGHTHGGQIRIYPFYKYAYKYIARMTHDFDKGLREFRGTKVFITTGIGLGGLPFRFLMPPVIDILEIE